jgi:Asp-tRNA(Asn)/Glu-tRNA(Gln) amidotransferase A subunit family amidase
MNTILELSAALRKRQLSPVELTRQCLNRIEKLNPALNAFILVTAKLAMEQAQRAEDEIASGKWRGPLHGIPVGLKDLIDTAGIPTTAASELYEHRIPIQNAEVVDRLEAAGAVLIGKQNLHEFAYGGSSMISCFGEVHNAWDVEHIAGGSSGGSASAIAAGLGYAAIGTDTAGSIREPSSLCGVVGLKPTFDLVSVRGVIPLSKSLDHVGPITRTVADAALVLQSIGERPLTKALPQDLEQAWRGRKLKLGVGVPRPYFYDDLDEDVGGSVEESLNVFRQLGCEQKEIRLEVSTDRTLQAAEAYAFHRESVTKTPELYQAETVRRILSGTNITHEQFEKARAELEKNRGEITSVFDEVDLIVTPTTPIPAPPIEELKRHPEQLRPHELVLLRNTRPFNVWGIPAISVPCGFTKAGLPIGLQIAGPWGRDDLVLQAAYAYEQATEWHERRPPL